MPKKPNTKFFINLDLLRPQSNSQKLIVNLFRWLLSAGRFLIVFVEIIVLAAFLARFKLDGDIAFTKEKIAQQIPYIDNLKSDEVAIRQIQFQLAEIKDAKQSSPDYSLSLRKIANQTPDGVIIDTLSFEKGASGVSFKFNGTAKTNDDLASLLYGLKQDKSFSDITLSNISLDQGAVTFSVNGSIASGGTGQNL